MDYIKNFNLRDLQTLLQRSDAIENALAHIRTCLVLLNETGVDRYSDKDKSYLSFFEYIDNNQVFQKNITESLEYAIDLQIKTDNNKIQKESNDNILIFPTRRKNGTTSFD